jgi:hypothetical protein
MLIEARRSGIVSSDVFAAFTPVGRVTPVRAAT